MKSALFLAHFALIMTGASALSQAPNPPRFEQFPRFTLAEGQLDADGLPISGAKLCLLARRDLCYQMPSETYGGSGSLAYQFGLKPRAERLPMAGGGSWVFFSAVFSGGGSGTLTRFALLRYASDGGVGRIVNLMPWVGATNVSDWAMWTVPGASAYPVLVHADFVWGDGEVHFDPHFYTVEAWKFDPNADRYIKALEYRTSRKYGGGDHSPIRVLKPEREEIIRRLDSK
jgi:hypothetical protein